jgi:hypothetical protein
MGDLFYFLDRITGFGAGIYRMRRIAIRRLFVAYPVDP